MVGMVTTRSIEDATLVELENGLVCLDRYGHRLLCHGRLQGALGPCGHVFVTRDSSLFDPGLAVRVEAAGPISSLVGVRILRAKLMALDVSERAVHGTTVAALGRGCSIAVHDLLL